jgi:hypothetical protein
MNHFTETTLTIGGRILPILNREQMAGILNSALATLDMMNCVLVQLADVLQKMKSDIFVMDHFVPCSHT